MPLKNIIFQSSGKNFIFFVKYTFDKLAIIGMQWVVVRWILVIKSMPVHSGYFEYSIGANKSQNIGKIIKLKHKLNSVNINAGAWLFFGYLEALIEKIRHRREDTTPQYEKKKNMVPMYSFRKTVTIKFKISIKERIYFIWIIF